MQFLKLLLVFLPLYLLCNSAKGAQSFSSAYKMPGDHTYSINDSSTVKRRVDRGIFVAPGLGVFFWPSEYGAPAFLSLHATAGYHFNKSVLLGAYNTLESWDGDIFYHLAMEARLMPNLRKTCPYALLQLGHGWPLETEYAASDGKYMALGVGINIPGKRKSSFTIDLCGQYQETSVYMYSFGGSVREEQDDTFATLLLRFGALL